MSPLNLLWGFVPSTVLRTAVSKGLFSLFESEADRLEIDQIAARLGWEIDGTTRILRILALIGVAHIEHCKVTLTADGFKWFHPKSPQTLVHYLTRCEKLELAYRNLDDILRNSCTSKLMFDETAAAFGGEPGATKDFLLTMHAADLEFAPALVKEVSQWKSPDRDWRFLDVGCGSGTLSYELRKKFRKATFNAFDIQGVIESAGAFASEIGYEGAIRLECGDWNTWDWETRRYDVILLSQVLHECVRDDAIRLFRNASSALYDEGILIVVMVGDGVSSNGDLLHAIFGVNMLVETGGVNPSAAWLDRLATDVELLPRGASALPGGRSIWIGQKVITSSARD